MVKAVVIGRHRMLPKQLEDLRRLGVDGFIQVPMIDEENIADSVEEWASKGARYIIVQALPVHLLHKLYLEASKQGLDVLIARMESIALVKSEEEAEKLVKENPGARTFLRARSGEAVRVVEFKGWDRIKQLHLELEPVTG
ncbi:MAG: hypothetical protein F7C33_02025 [Desulfurococcales archaeon]|nr:hypothetical protein [Desulfurococcales archaeon]